MCSLLLFSACVTLSIPASEPATAAPVTATSPAPVPPPSVTTPTPATPPTPSNPLAARSLRSPLEELVGLMTGSFSSALQHERDEKNYFDIRLHMTPIWPERSSVEKGFWLYVEQAVATDPERPYRQRIYRVFTEEVAGASGAKTRVFKSEVYLLPGKPDDVLKFAGAWREPAKLEALKSDQLTLKDGCTVVLTRTAPSTYDGATVGKGCPSERGGATYASAEVHVSAAGLKTWDRGFNDKDEQVWGATQGPYIFDRVDPKP